MLIVSSVFSLLWDGLPCSTVSTTPTSPTTGTRSTTGSGLVLIVSSVSVYCGMVCPVLLYQLLQHLPPQEPEVPHREWPCVNCIICFSLLWDGLPCSTVSTTPTSPTTGTRSTTGKQGVAEFLSPSCRNVLHTKKFS